MNPNKRRTTIEKITNEREKQVTFCKRKKGIIKKAIELSKLCDTYIYFVIFDQNKQKLIEFKSDSEFDIKVVQQLCDPGLPSKIVHEQYSNSDLANLSSKQYA